MVSGNDYKMDLYSQFGEDGIISHFLGLIPKDRRTKRVIEFGAADGLFCSNTARLWLSGYEALLIESDPAHYAKLETFKNARVKTLQAKVDDLEDFTSDIADVCSIDVDGNEYQILQRLKTKHTILVVEHNPTVPPHVRMVNLKDSMQGSSALSLTELCVGMGYTLVAATTSNLIFTYQLDVEGYEQDLGNLFDYSCLNYVVTDYHGKYDMVGRWPYGMTEPRTLGLTE
jgi:hypothetical protein